MTESPYSGVHRALRGAVGSFLILVTPFAVFLQYHGYGFLRPEVILVLLVMAGLALLAGAAATISPALEAAVLAGLLTLFMDLQFDPPAGMGMIGSAFTFLVLTSALWLVLTSVLWLLREQAARIVTLMMATVLASSLLVPRSSAVAIEGAMFPSSHRPASGSEELPFILHLIVDEHIGIEGMPADLTPASFERDVRSFYNRQGFLLFGRACTRYLEFAPVHRASGQSAAGRLRAGTSPPRNALDVGRDGQCVFNRLAQLGYAIRVYQSDYLDLCADHTSAPRCQTYASTTLRPLAPVALPASQKARVVAGMYLDQSNLYRLSHYVYKRARLRVAPIVALPAWNWERDRIGPLGSMSVLDAVASDLSRAQRGDFLMAHLMMPHYPYVYNANCELRQPQEWLERVDGDAPPGVVNTVDSRATRYARYFEQASCV